MACTPPRPIYDLPMKGRIRSPLHQAILDGRLHYFRILVEKMAADVNAKDVYGWTPLILCCLIDDETIGLRCMKILTKKQVDINQNDVLQRTALHYCCIGGRQRLTHHLVNGFEALDVYARDCYSHTPLMYAAMRGRPSIVHLLTKKYVASAVSVDERDSRGRTALMIACACGNYASAHILLTVGKAGKYRRDDLFFRSPAEWVDEAEAVREEELRRENDPLVRLTIPLNAPVGFDRRMTRLLRLPKMDAMYDRAKPFVCEHTRKTSGYYSECFNELVRGIPEMFTHFHVLPNRLEEQFINGQDSRKVLLTALEDPLPPDKPCKPVELSPLISSATSIGPSRGSSTGVAISNSQLVTQPLPPARCISTPKFIELRPNPDRMMVPDLVTLFQMYVPRDPIEKKSTAVPDATQDQKSIQQSQPTSPLPKVVHLAQYH